VAAGFPCIDVSRAGLRQGLEGPVSAREVSFFSSRASMPSPAHTAMLMH
jgi:hypothetical protein